MRSSGAKTTRYWKLPCLCLIAATMAFAMVVLIAPYMSGKASSSDDLARQLIPPNQVWMESSSSQVVEDLPVVEDQTPALAVPGRPSTTVGLVLSKLSNIFVKLSELPAPWLSLPLIFFCGFEGRG
jgi:hypothetical protein